MSVDVWIIRRNTPESKYLGKIGINRDHLEVVKLKGRAKYRGGYGKAASEWRVSGEIDLKILCNGLIGLLEKKPNRTSMEIATLERARKMLKTFSKRHHANELKIVNNKKRMAIVKRLVITLYPCATERDIEIITDKLEDRSVRSIEELHLVINATLGRQVDAWKDATAEFYSSLKANIS